LYFVEAWESEVILQQLILSFFDERDRKEIWIVYEAMRDKCNSMDKLLEIVGKEILPIINRQVLYELAIAGKIIRESEDEKQYRKLIDLKSLIDIIWPDTNLYIEKIKEDRILLEQFGDEYIGFIDDVIKYVNPFLMLPDIERETKSEDITLKEFIESESEEQKLEEIKLEEQNLEVEE